MVVAGYVLKLQVACRECSLLPCVACVRGSHLVHSSMRGCDTTNACLPDSEERLVAWCLCMQLNGCCTATDDSLSSGQRSSVCMHLMFPLLWLMQCCMMQLHLQAAAFCDKCLMLCADATWWLQSPLCPLRGCCIRGLAVQLLLAVRHEAM
jgi:hypothetical protein